MILLAMGKRKLDPKGPKNTNVFSPKIEGEYEAKVLPFNIFFLVLLSSSRHLAGQVEIHLRNLCSNSK